MRVVCGGGIGAEIFAVFGGGVCRGVYNWSGSGGGGNFLLVKNRDWYLSWQGEHRNTSKTTWRGNGGENPRKGPSQVSPCGERKNENTFNETSCF